MKKRQLMYLPFKRLFGLLGSLIGIIFCFALLWWWVIIINSIVTKGHPFFTHSRVGKKGKAFKIIKFRSMKLNVNPDMTSEFVNLDETTTKFGKFLRKTSIDETPQLLNIFIGKMAFIGPRPLIDAHEDHITVEIRKENGAINIRPGMSGYAQIHGRTSVSPKDKGELDGYYYRHFGLWLDIKIFFSTLLRIFGSGQGK